MWKRCKAAIIATIVFLSYVGSALAYPVVVPEERMPIGMWYEPRECLHVDSEWSHDCAGAVFRMGRAFIDVHDFGAAVMRFSQALQIREYSIVYNNRAVAYFELGRYELSRRDTLRAISMTPRSHEPWYNLAMIDFRLKRYRKSLSHINTSIDLRPTDPESYDLRASVYRKLGMRDRARENERIARSMRETGPHGNTEKGHADAATKP